MEATGTPTPATGADFDRTERPRPLPVASGGLALLEPQGHPRRRIAEEVRAKPGVSITDLAAATGLGHTTVCHHLEVLQRRGVVVRERWGGAVRVFPTDLSPTHRSLLAVARSGRTGDVLRALAEDPRATPATLARTLGVHRQAVQWHLTRLERAGVVRVDREHRPYRLQLTVRRETVLRVLPPSAAAAGAPAEPPPVAEPLADAPAAPG